MMGKANFQDFDFQNFGGFGDIFDAFFGGSPTSRSRGKVEIYIKQSIYLLRTLLWNRKDISLKELEV